MALINMNVFGDVNDEGLVKYYVADKPISGVAEPRSAGVTRATTTRMNTKSAAEIDAIDGDNPAPEGAFSPEFDGIDRATTTPTVLITTTKTPTTTITGSCQ